MTMTTTTTPTTTPWANTPFTLCPIPTTSPTTHPAHQIAHMMAGIHNVFLRSINSIYQQAPYITHPTDVLDLLTYTSHWTSALHAHHTAEETLAFPAFERISAGQWSNVAERNRSEHILFNRRLEDLTAYIHTVRDSPGTYSAPNLTRIIDDVMAVLHAHLLAEIATIEDLAAYPAAPIAEAWKALEAEVQKGSSMYSLVPLMVGAHDATYPGHETTFPQFPFFMPWVIHYIFERPERGVWRFNPCDSWSRPRALCFGPEGAEGQEGQE